MICAHTWNTAGRMRVCRLCAAVEYYSRGRAGAVWVCGTSGAITPATPVARPARSATPRAARAPSLAERILRVLPPAGMTAAILAEATEIPLQVVSATLHALVQRKAVAVVGREPAAERATRRSAAIYAPASATGGDR